MSASVNKIVKFRRKTISDCIFQLTNSRKSVIVDCPKRDKAIWTADLYVSGPAAAKFLKNGAGYWKNSLLAIASKQYKNGKIPACVDLNLNYRFLSPFSDDFCMWWILSVYQYCKKYKDPGFVKKILPAVKKAVLFLFSKIDADGIYKASVINFDWDWTNIRPRKSVLSNMLFYEVLKACRFFKITINIKPAKFKNKLNNYFWNPKLNAYADKQDTVYLDANCLAITFGVSDPAKSNKILTSLNSLNTHFGPLNAINNFTLIGNWHKDLICPFAGYLYAKALKKMGKNRDAKYVFIKTMSAAIKNSEKYNLQTLPEFWKKDGKCQTPPAKREFEHRVSYCHAWSTFGDF